MHRLSHWGSQHPAAARFIITVLYCIMVFLVICLGKLMALQGVSVPEWITYLLAACAGLLLFFYAPQKKIGYRKSRFFHGGLLFVGLLGYTLITCQLAAPEAPALMSSQVGQEGNYARFTTLHKKDISEREARKAKRAEKRSVRKRVRAEVRQWVKNKKGQKKMNTVGAVLLGILIVFGVITLGTVVLALACSLACSGASALGVLVAVVGLGGVFYLGFLAFRDVIRKLKRDNDLRPKKQKPEKSR